MTSTSHRCARPVVTGLLATAMAMAMALSACGVAGSDADPVTTTASASTTTAPEDGGASSTVATSSDAPAEDADAPSEDAGAGDRFASEDGRYTIRVDPSWTRASGTFANGVEAWAVGERTDGFTPNLTVLTQKTDLTIDQYRDLSVRQTDRLIDDAELIPTEEVVEGTAGQQLGILDYRGTTQGRELHFYAVFTPVRDGMALATFTATEDQFDELYESVEPSLLSLRAA